MLGGFSLELDHSGLELPGRRRAQELLGWLGLHPGLHPRSELAARFWPDVLDASARTSLRTTLASLRSALSPGAADALIATREQIGLSDDHVWVDAREFAARLEAGRLTAAAELYRGDLLAGFGEDWVLAERDRLRERFAGLLGSLAAEADAEGRAEEAIAWARRRAEVDPLGEEAHRDLMRLLVAAGDRAAALVVYNRFAARLADQLRTVPSPSTRALADAARSRPDGLASSLGDQPLPPPLQTRDAGPFVGRRTELARLRELFAQRALGAPGEQQRLVVLQGEAGIGKTRLAAELARTLADDGASVLYGRCDEELSIPYQPFREALERYVSRIDAAQLYEALGSHADQLGRLLPEIGDLGGTGPTDSESSRFELFEAIAALLGALASARPTLLVIDDLHWAPPPTVLLFRHLLRSEPVPDVLYLITCREGEVQAGSPLARLLADLGRDARLPRLEIDGLDRAAVAEMLEHARAENADVELDPDLVTEIVADTGGNPFFVGEVLAAVSEGGRVSSAPGELELGRLPVSGGARAVVGARIARLSEQATRAAETVAVAGADFSLGVLTGVHGDRLELHDGIDEAVAMGLLNLTGDGGYAFSHAIARKAVYEEIGEARRTWLHLRVAETLEAAGAAGPAALAHHFGLAADEGYAEKAAAYAREAALDATARLAYEDAVAHCEHGLEALDRSNEALPELRYELQLALAEALWSCGEGGSARSACEKAVRIADELGESELLARAALAFAGPPRFEIATAEATPVVQLLDRSRRELGQDGRALRAQVLGRLAAALAFSPGDVRRGPLAREALAAARECGDESVLADVVASSYFASRGPENLPERLESTHELTRLAASLGESRLESLARFWACTDHLELCQVSASEAELDQLEDLADRLAQHYPRWLAATARARTAHIQGRLEDYEGLMQDGLALGKETGEAGAQVFAGQLMALRREQGRLGELRQAAESFVEQYPDLPIWRCALAYVYAELDRPTDARRIFDQLGEDGFVGIPRDALWPIALASLSEVAFYLEDQEGSEQLYLQLEPFADRCLVSDSVACQGSAGRSLGLLATTCGRLREAETHFRRALDVNRDLGADLWLAYTECDYAALLLKRGAGGDQGRALDLLRRAARRASQLGLTALRGRIGRATASATGAGARGGAPLDPDPVAPEVPAGPRK